MTPCDNQGSACSFASGGSWSRSGRVQHPRASQYRGTLAAGNAAEQGQVDRSAESFRKVHLQAAQGEQSRRVARGGLDEEINIAVRAEPVAEDGPEEVEPDHTDTTARLADAGQVEGDIVKAEHPERFYGSGTEGWFRHGRWCSGQAGSGWDIQRTLPPAPARREGEGNAPLVL